MFAENSYASSHCQISFPCAGVQTVAQSSVQQHDRHGAKGVPACSTYVPTCRSAPAQDSPALLQALDASHTEHMRQFFPGIRSLTLNTVQFSGNTALCLATVTQLQALELHKCTFTEPEDLVVLGALPGEHGLSQTVCPVSPAVVSEDPVLTETRVHPSGVCLTLVCTVPPSWRHRLMLCWVRAVVPLGA